MIRGAQKLFSGVNAPLMPQFRDLYDFLVDELDCSADVKTIYVAFNLRSGPVAAIHPHGGKDMEVAMALPEEPLPSVYLAPHLKWRTLPVARQVTPGESAAAVFPLLRKAAKRVSAGVHDVEQPNERFYAKRRPL
jgi:hypothetical protein